MTEQQMEVAEKEWRRCASMLIAMLQVYPSIASTARGIRHPGDLDAARQSIRRAMTMLSAARARITWPLRPYIRGRETLINRLLVEAHLEPWRQVRHR